MRIIWKRARNISVCAVLAVLLSEAPSVACSIQFETPVSASAARTQLEIAARAFVNRGKKRSYRFADPLTKGYYLSERVKDAYRSRGLKMSVEAKLAIRVLDATASTLYDLSVIPSNIRRCARISGNHLFDAHQLENEYLFSARRILDDEARKVGLLISELDRDCDDFQSWDSAQSFFRRYPSDPSNLDADNDGVVCEHLLR